MVSLIFICALSCALSAVIVPITKTVALRRGFLDLPNERSSHVNPTPRTGGISILIGALFGFFIGLGMTQVGSTSAVSITPSFVLIIALICGAILGFLDDAFRMPTGIRLFGYLLIAGVISNYFCYVSVIDVPLIPSVNAGIVGGVLFSTLFIAWYTNLFNFMDGIDGIAGCVAFVSLSSLAVVFFAKGFFLLGILAITVAAATSGFLLYNFPPASVFMGDGGSVFLGMTIGALSLAAVKEGILSLAATVFFTLPFVFDATFTLLRRILGRERFWTAHRSHIYQQMCDLGFSHRKVTIIYTVGALFFAGIGSLFDTWTDAIKGSVWWGSWVALLVASIIIVMKNKKASC
jgi:Fuc2NAc and GlcNAc transferase